MSGLLAVVIDRETICAVSASAAGTDAFERSWHAADLDATLASLRAAVGAPSGIVLVVGLGWLEIAEPTLPPVDAATAREIVWREIDRHFALEASATDASAAVVCEGRFAFALPAATLQSWVDRLRTLAPIRAIVTAPQVAMDVVAHSSSTTADATMAAGADERGRIRIRDGQLLSVRRVPTALQEATPSSMTAVAASAIATRALRWADAPLSAQLLDASLLRSRIRDATRRTWTSAMLATAAVALLAFAAAHRREAQLDSLRAEIAQLEVTSAPGARASARVSQATAEASVLRDARATVERSDSPLRVLAQLTRVLPADVVVQKIEWDGAQWRVEGTADKAPRLVPLLDSDPHFRDVRMIAPSQRFLDIGRQRETFTIGFHVTATPARSTADSMTDSARTVPTANGGARGSF